MIKQNLYKILVPTINNDGLPFTTAFHRIWDRHICDMAGGITILRPVFGKWKHQGRSYQERNIPVNIICDRPTLVQIMKFTKEYYNQEAVLAYKVSSDAIIYT